MMPNLIHSSRLAFFFVITKSVFSNIFCKAKECQAFNNMYRFTKPFALCSSRIETQHWVHKWINSGKEHVLFEITTVLKF
jgi:hypothetical protein